MTSLFGGRGTEDGRIAAAPALAPGDMDGDRRVMTLLGLPGAWLRRLRSLGLGSSDRPGSPGRASAGGRAAAALHGVGRLSRAVVPALLLLTLLAGVATQAHAYHTPVAYFGSVSQSVDEGASLARVPVRLTHTQPYPIRVWYSVGGTATGGSDFLISGHRGQNKVEIPAGAGTATIPVTLIDDSVQEGSETVILTIVPDNGGSYRPAFLISL